MANKVVQIGQAKKRLREGKLLNNAQISVIEQYGSKSEKQHLRALNQQWIRKYDLHPQKELEMKIMVKELNHPCFIGAVQKLDTCSKYPSMQTAYHVMKLVKSCHEAIKENRELYKKLVLQYSNVDEKGEVKLKEGSQEIDFKNDEAEKEYQKKFEEFMTTHVVVKGTPLNLNDLENVGFSPIELDAIEPLIDKASLPA